MDLQSGRIELRGPNGGLGVLVSSADFASASSTPAGTTDLAGEDPSYSTHVQALESGNVRMLTQISDSTAPTEYRYQLDLAAHMDAAVGPDGRLYVVRETKDTFELVYSTALPWATDAAGKSLETWYSLDGSVLIQHVTHAGATYPVVADPEWEAGDFKVAPPSAPALGGATFDGNKRGSQALAVGDANLCGLGAAFSGPLAPLIGSLCVIDSGVQGTALLYGQCLAIDIPPTAVFT